ncbi:MAG: (d)CMP kinase [Firmicutes bacterium]|nr:(d)CMP kinase [Bacillota bacterium]
MKNISQGFAIAIDGPGGVGKSTTARLVAELLGITYIDTGAMYRAVAFYSIQNGIDVSNPDKLETSLQNISIELRYANRNQRVHLNGQDISDFIRTQEISGLTPIVAANEAVREKLVTLQQEMAKQGAVVMDGRDIGSQVLPWAQVKIYLDAPPEIRARRRMLDLESKGQAVDFEQILQEIILRDYRDKTRTISPLVQTADAVYIDTAHMNPQEVADKIASYAKELLPCSTNSSE